MSVLILDERAIFVGDDKVVNDTKDVVFATKIKVNHFLFLNMNGKMFGFLKNSYVKVHAKSYSPAKI